jgi:uncharacterized protein DUF2510
MSAPEAGWYVNPSGPGRRYWDGSGWTEHIDDSAPAAQYASPSSSAPPPAPPAPPPPPDPAFYGAQGPQGPPPNPYYPPPPPGPYPHPAYGQPSQGVSGLVVVGYVTAVLIPIVGFVLGIVAATRRYEPQTARHGVWVIVVSVVAFVIWLAILSSQQTTYSY